MTSILQAHKAFPKRTYPTETHTETHSARQYALGTSDANGNATYTFNLGVYSLSPYRANSSTLVPTDPLCLLTLLSIINRKETASKFPTIDDDISIRYPQGLPSTTTQSTISILAYNSAIDDQLPILVEDNTDSVNHHVTRKIHHTHVINSLNSSKLSTPDQLTFNLLNTYIFDYFILNMLQLNDETLLKYYSLTEYNFPQTLQNLAPLTSVLASKIRLHLTKRNDFNIRNPSTHSYYTSLVNPKYSREAFISEAARIRSNATDLLEELNKAYETTKYWGTDDNVPSVIDLQIASYFYAISHMASVSKDFAEDTAAYTSLENLSTTIMDQFV